MKRPNAHIKKSEQKREMIRTGKKESLIPQVFTSLSNDWDNNVSVRNAGNIDLINEE